MDDAFQAEVTEVGQEQDTAPVVFLHNFSNSVYAVVDGQIYVSVIGSESFQKCTLGE